MSSNHDPNDPALWPDTPTGCERAAKMEAALEQMAQPKRSTMEEQPQGVGEVDFLRARIATLEAELARIRPVYEAACAWVDGGADLAQACANTDTLVDAVRVARSKP